MSLYDYEVEVHIEIPLGSNIKYEYDHNTNKLIVDRLIHSPVYYFFNYGYIPNTLGGDGDPLDAVVLCRESFHPMSYIQCKLIGVINTTDEKGQDDKLILVPIDKIDKESEQYNNIDDISNHTKERLICFFEDYKKLEPEKWINVNKTLGNKYDAMNLYVEAEKRHKKSLNPSIDL